MGEEWWISTTDSGNNSSSSKCNILKGMCVQARIAKYHGTNFLQHNLQVQFIIIIILFLSIEIEITNYELIHYIDDMSLLFLINLLKCINKYTASLHFADISLNYSIFLQPQFCLLKVLNTPNLWSKIL